MQGNAERILTVLDSNLHEKVRLVIYGRAALALGFENPPPEVNLSLDVDVIIPVSEVEGFRLNERFWDAQEKTNKSLSKEGLYITHLFEASQVFLRKQWEQNIVPLTRPGTDNLRLFRPATIDLILTKMMRGTDPQDMRDVQFLLTTERVSEQQMIQAFQETVIPDIIELRDAFEAAKPAVLEMIRTKE